MKNITSHPTYLHALRFIILALICHHTNAFSLSTIEGLTGLAHSVYSFDIFDDFSGYCHMNKYEKSSDFSTTDNDIRYLQDALALSIENVKKSQQFYQLNKATDQNKREMLRDQFVTMARFSSLNAFRLENPNCDEVSKVIHGEIKKVSSALAPLLGTPIMSKVVKKIRPFVANVAMISELQYNQFFSNILKQEFSTQDIHQAENLFFEKALEELQEQISDILSDLGDYQAGSNIKRIAKPIYIPFDHALGGFLGSGSKDYQYLAMLLNTSKFEKKSYADIYALCRLEEEINEKDFRKLGTTISLTVATVFLSPGASVARALGTIAQNSHRIISAITTAGIVIETSDIALAALHSYRDVMHACKSDYTKQLFLDPTRGPAEMSSCSSASIMGVLAVLGSAVGINQLRKSLKVGKVGTAAKAKKRSSSLLRGPKLDLSDELVIWLGRHGINYKNVNNIDELKNLVLKKIIRHMDQDVRYTIAVSNVTEYFNDVDNWMDSLANIAKECRKSERCGKIAKKLDDFFNPGELHRQISNGFDLNNNPVNTGGTASRAVIAHAYAYVFDHSGDGIYSLLQLMATSRPVRIRESVKFILEEEGDDLVKYIRKNLIEEELGMSGKILEELGLGFLK
ncbi:MAG: hypothetical protein HOE90_07810 [Bacteriovoracaceae bacterium]|jgi:hypothetical protein|nr:hypothetical protein [Bacteriovoracaceae bacterium]